MNRFFCILLLAAILLPGCVTQFVPDITGEEKALVVEARLTDRNETYVVRVSSLRPVYGEYPEPHVGITAVSVLDDTGNEYPFTYHYDGTFRSDSTVFTAMPGRKYKLRLVGTEHSYESDFIEMIPVPCIDSLYAGPEENEFYRPGETTWGYQVSLDTHDPSGLCRFYMWTYEETWEFRYPYRSPYMINRICWKSARSADINILSTTSLDESRVIRQPVTFITNETDRLIVRYSILVRQYSITEEEFVYRENVRRTVFESGGLYDAIPGSITGNIRCIDDPSQQVLGFFGVSAVSEKRMFIENVQAQFPDFYAWCRTDTVTVTAYQNGNYGPGVYILLEWWEPPAPPYYILSIHRECTDCSMIGTAVKPDYWDESGQFKTVQISPDEKK